MIEEVERVEGGLEECWRSKTRYRLQSYRLRKDLACVKRCGVN